MLCDRCQAEIDRDGKPTKSSVFMLALVNRGEWLTPTEQKIFVILWDRRDRVVTRNTMMNLLYYDRIEPPGDTILNNYMQSIRRVLTGTNLSVNTIRGEGWQMKELQGADDAES